MKAPKVKICGLTQVEDALLAAELGAWAIGLIFAEKSQRKVSFEVAREVSGAVPQQVQRIGVFVDATIREVVETVQKVRLTGVQMHGGESPEYCAELKTELGECLVIKAQPVKDEQSLLNLQSYSMCDALLLDTYCANQDGGTGRTFDWSLVKEMQRSLPLILAGGLNADNIKEAVRAVQPEFVDVSSGVEEAPGLKSERLLRDFFASVKEIGDA